MGHSQKIEMDFAEVLLGTHKTASAISNGQSISINDHGEENDAMADR